MRSTISYGDSPESTLLGSITKLGYYRDTLPQLVISISKKLAGDIPSNDGERLPITLQVGDEQYFAGIRTSANSRTLQICPDLINLKGEKVRLTDIILENGLEDSHWLELTLVDNVVLHVRGCQKNCALSAHQLPKRRKSRRMLSLVQ